VNQSQVKNKNIKIILSCIVISAGISIAFNDLSVLGYASVVMNFAAITGFYYGNQLLADYLNKKLSQKRHRLFLFMIQLPASLLIGIVLLLLRNQIAWVIRPAYHKLSFNELLKIDLIFSVTLITLFEAIEFFRCWKDYIVYAERVEKEHLLAQYETLRNQLNPHFLFNGLNTLVTLIEKDDLRAAVFTQKLADFLKYLLTLHNEKLISLKQELEVVNQYLFIQQLRFANSLEIVIELEDEICNRLLPPLSLQMLVENAVKHNQISPKRKLVVNIFEENDYLFVKNNLQPKTGINSANIGLENIKGRYKLFTDKELIITNYNNYFVVGIPLLKEK
jgi:sensor histidine kinase YesM